MKAHARTPPGTLALVYWLLVVCGLAGFTWRHVLDLEEIVPLWAGTVLGVGLGQVLARARMRMWLAAFVVVNMMWIGLVLSVPIWWMDSSPVGKLALMAFAPGALCGYLSLSERGGLVAFWLPAALWMLSILDRSGAARLEGGESWFFLTGLAVLFLAFLHARETRRVALWRSCGATRIAAARPPAVLRRAPLRAAAQAGWLAFTGIATLALTAWVAPHLWQTEKVDSRVAPAANSAPSAKSGSYVSAASHAMACCPEPAITSVERHRVLEYFPLLEANDEVKRAPPLGSCVACAHGAPLPTQGWTGSNTTIGSVPSLSPQASISQVGVPAVAGGSSGASVTAPVAAGAAAGTAAVVPPAPAAGSSKPLRPDVPSPGVQEQKPDPSDPPSAAMSLDSPPAHATPSPPSAVALGERAGANPAGLLVTVVACALIVHIAMRPLRRLVTLRHLRSALWPESVDQRVSNLWQLALVGLRDAGWHMAPGEQPQELARRVGVEGVDSCATVLERARHGVQVDADDLEQMGRAAASAYDAARSRVGWVSRAAGWLRWPLV